MSRGIFSPLSPLSFLSSLLSFLDPPSALLPPHLRPCAGKRVLRRRGRDQGQRELVDRPLLQDQDLPQCRRWRQELYLCDGAGRCRAVSLREVGRSGLEKPQQGSCSSQPLARSGQLAARLVVSSASLPPHPRDTPTHAPTATAIPETISVPPTRPAASRTCFRARTRQRAALSTPLIFQSQRGQTAG